MAIHAGRDIAMGIGVAEVTGEGGMLARIGKHLLVGAGMAGDADDLMLAGQVDLQRLMRVVAAEAVVNFIVGAARMTVAALGDIVRNTRAMPFVAGLAIDFRFVGGTIGGNLRRLLAVTFDAVVNGQHGLFGERDSTQAGDKNQRHCRNQQFTRLTLQHLTSSLELDNPICDAETANTSG